MQRPSLSAIALIFLIATNNHASAAAPQQEEAVRLARAGQYAEALQQLRQLEASGVSQAIWDRIVVLVWAGQYAEAIAAYESLPSQPLPDYVPLHLGGAYYQQGRFREAAALFHQAAQHSGDRQTLRWEAESLLLSQSTLAGNALYQELLSSEPHDVETLFSRATTRLRLGQNPNDDFSAAQQSCTTAQEKMRLRARIGAAYIHADQYGPAITTLRDLLRDGSTEATVQADYILALRLNGDYLGAVAEGKRLWPTASQAPAYGVQALADASLRANKLHDAIRLYDQLLTRELSPAARQAALTGKAYAQLLDGDTANGRSSYATLLQSYPASADAVSGDAVLLFEAGRYDAAKELFSALFQFRPTNPHDRQRYALLLQAHNMPREAADQYALLSQRTASPEAAAGLTVCSLAAADHAAARAGYQQLSGQTKNLPQFAQALEQFAHRTRSELSLTSSAQSDHKRLVENEVRLHGETKISDRLAVASEVGRFTNSDADSRSNYFSQGVGFHYQSLRDDARILLNRYYGDINANGYALSYLHHFSDQARWRLELASQPVHEAGALLAGIRQTTQRLSFERSLGKFNHYDFGFTRSAYNDGNQAFGFDGSWTHSFSKQDDIERDWSVYASRNRHKYQSDAYESPRQREAYGLRLRQRWEFPLHYWEHSLQFEWNRDSAETTNFAPHQRLEYGYRFSPGQLLIFGAEYGLHSSGEYGGLRFDYRKYDLNYMFKW